MRAGVVQTPREETTGLDAALTRTKSIWIYGDLKLPATTIMRNRCARCACNRLQGVPMASVVCRCPTKHAVLARLVLKVMRESYDHAGMIPRQAFARHSTRSWHYVKELPRKRNFLFTSVVGKQAIVADTVEATRQYMQQEATHEPIGGKRHGLVSWLIRVALVAIVFPSEGYAALIHRDQPGVGNGHPVRIARQIGQHLGPHFQS